MRRAPPVHSRAGRVLAVPASADAATRHVVRGAGWGHGIGMSQYGAYGYALEGSGYRAILAHYYTRHPPDAGRPALRAGAAPARRPVHPRARRHPRRRHGAEARRRPTSRARPRGGIALFGPSRQARGALLLAAAARAPRPASLRLLGPALNGVSDGLYRGAIEVHAERRPRRDQRALARRLRARRGGRRDALVLAARGAQGPGRDRAHLRAGHAQAGAARSTSIRTRARRSTAA